MTTTAERDNRPILHHSGLFGRPTLLPVMERCVLEAMAAHIERIPDQGGVWKHPNPATQQQAVDAVSPLVRCRWSAANRTAIAAQVEALSRLPVAPVPVHTAGYAHQIKNASPVRMASMVMVPALLEHLSVARRSGTTNLLEHLIGPDGTSWLTHTGGWDQAWWGPADQLIKALGWTAAPERSTLSDQKVWAQQNNTRVLRALQRLNEFAAQAVWAAGLTECAAPPLRFYNLVNPCRFADGRLTKGVLVSETFVLECAKTAPDAASGAITAVEDDPLGTTLSSTGAVVLTDNGYINAGSTIAHPGRAASLNGAMMFASPIQAQKFLSSVVKRHGNEYNGVVLTISATVTGIAPGAVRPAQDSGLAGAVVARLDQNELAATAASQTTTDPAAADPIVHAPRARRM